MSRFSFMYLFSAIVLTANVLVFSNAATAQERLMVIGGGQRPAKALETFGTWAGGSQGRLLIIAWAAKEDPLATARTASSEFREQFSGEIDTSISRPLDPASQEAFLVQLDQASGVFFTGGDQKRILEVLSQAPLGSVIRNAMVEAYDSGIPFGGTSAGTAIMSPVMIVSQRNSGKILPDKGLGFFAIRRPDGSTTQRLVVDQHFSQRRRETRLLPFADAIKSQLVIGIDEDTALMLQDRRRGEVVGEHRVRIFSRANSATPFQETQLTSGDQFDFISDTQVFSPGPCEDLLK